MSVCSKEGLRVECLEVQKMIGAAKQDLEKGCSSQSIDWMQRALHILQPRVLIDLEMLPSHDERAIMIHRCFKDWIDASFEINSEYMKQREVEQEGSARDPTARATDTVTRVCKTFDLSVNRRKVSMRSLVLVARASVRTQSLEERVVRAIESNAKTNELATLFSQLEKKLGIGFLFPLYEKYNQSIPAKDRLYFVFDEEECRELPERIKHPKVFMECLRYTLCSAIREKGGSYLTAAFQAVYDYLKDKREEYPEVLADGSALGLNYGPYYLLADHGRALSEALKRAAA